jgi:CRP-like cAMP-binding protein
MYATGQTDFGFHGTLMPFGLIRTATYRGIRHRKNLALPDGACWIAPPGQESLVSVKQRVATSNRLIAALPERKREVFLADCTLVDLTFSSVLYELGDRLLYVYFPIDGFISMLTAVDHYSTLEVGMIGREGMCGYTVSLGDTTAPLRALTQGAGSAWRMKSATFRRHLEHTPELRRVVDRYMCVLLRQLAQTAACTRFHVVEKRLARWLLMTHDRASADSFEVTQEFLAFMLGVRRSGVTAAASTLQSRNLIRYRRGNMTVVNRERLEAAACTCYQADLDIYVAGLSSRTTR